MVKAKEFYNNLYSDESYEGGSNDAVFKFAQIRRELIKIKPQGFASALDIGCSSGRFILNFVKAKKKYGTDISEKTVAKAKENGVIARCIDIEEEPLPFKNVEVIFFLDVLEHLFSPLDALKKCYGSIAKGGYVVISLPNDVQNIFRLTKTFFGNSPLYEYKGNGHIRFFGTKSIRRILKDAGFDVVLVRGYGKIPLNELFPDQLSFGYIAIGRKK